MFLQKQPLEVFFEKKLFWKILQYSQENTCAGASFLIQLQALDFSKKKHSNISVFLWILQNF